MKTVNSTKNHILVFGIPRSGTTIICNYINSLQNGYCISEPILGSELNPEMIVWDKIQGTKASNPQEIISHSKTQLENSNFVIGGIKEIWTPLHRSFTKEAFQSEDFDNILFVIRNPIDIFASWRATTWSRQLRDDEQGFLSYNDPKYLIHTYEEYLKLFEQNKSKCKVLIYENFIKSPQRAMLLCGIMIEGESELRRNVYKLGDGDARKSRKVGKTPSKRDLLDDEEIKEIESSEIFKAFQRIQEENSKVLQHP